MKQIILTFITILSIGFGATAQNVTIPDANFKAYLVGNTAINTNADTEIQITEAAAFTGEIYCRALSISDLTGIEAFIALDTLDCTYNQLTSLDLSQNIMLTELKCHNNQLTALDVTQNTALIYLTCQTNQLTALDISQNLGLTIFRCDYNQIQSLNLIQHTGLTLFWCNQNQLTTLDVTQNLGLTNLSCGGNQLTVLDVSPNIALTTLWCSNNQLTALNVSQHTALLDLSCSTNQLTTLDITQNTALTDLSCGSNQLTVLDATQNTVLTKLYCDNNQLTTLDITQNTVLENFSFKSNNLTSIDLSQNAALEYFHCGSNPNLSFPNLRSNLNLNNLGFDYATFTHIDLSFLPLLRALNCSHNSQLIQLNVANGNNSNFTWYRTNNNSNLTCIQVDDVAYSNSTNRWINNIDAAASFSANCPCDVYIPDANFKTYLVGNSNINTNGDTEIQCSEASAFTGGIFCQNQSISNLTGLEYFTNLTLLNCSANSISSLDVSYNLNLIGLFANDVLITELDVTLNTALTQLTGLNNVLRSLNVANGNNSNIVNFDFVNNPNLTCIEVDDVAYSTTNWTVDIDAIASFSTNCSTTTGIKRLTNKINLSVYPNPVTSQLNIETAATIESIAIYDLLGKLIQTENTTHFSVQNLENGVYLLKIKTNKGLVSKQFIKAS